MEAIIFLIGLVIVLITIALLIKVSLLAMFVIVFVLLWLTIILIVPKRNSSEKVYQGIWWAIEQSSIFLCGKTGIVQKLKILI